MSSENPPKAKSDLPAPRKNSLRNILLLLLPFFLLFIIFIIVAAVLTVPKHTKKPDPNAPLEFRDYPGPPGPCYVNKTGDATYTGSFWCCKNKIYEDVEQVSVPIAGFAEPLYLGGSCKPVPDVDKVNKAGARWREFCDPSAEKPLLGCCNTKVPKGVKDVRGPIQVWCVDMDATADFKYR